MHTDNHIVIEKEAQIKKKINLSQEALEILMVKVQENKRKIREREKSFHSHPSKY